jgi:hypothetical protein
MNTTPAAYDDKLTPAVSLGGQKWPIPEFVWRQLRHTREPIIAMSAALIGKPKPEEQSEPDDFQTRWMRMTGEQAETVGEIVYQGLLGAHPKMTREEFGDMRITDGELLDAFLTMRRQCGIYVFSTKSEEGEGAGEE